MRKKLALLALAGFGFLWATSATAIIYPPCDTNCTSANTQRCSCPGTVINTTCAAYYGGFCDEV